MDVRERLGAWLVTGPIGRLVAFVLDFAAALITVARRGSRDA